MFVTTHLLGEWVAVMCISTCLAKKNNNTCACTGIAERAPGALTV